MARPRALDDSCHALYEGDRVASAVDMGANARARNVIRT
jgi:hypothetical protein